MPEEVRELVETFFSHDTQGWDWKQEGGNRRVKRAVCGNTKQGLPACPPHFKPFFIE